MRKNEATRLLAVIAETWRGFEVSEGKASIWSEMLADVSLDLALRAVKYLIACGTPFPPSISEIRRAIVEMSAPPEYQIDALQSWLEASLIVEGYCEEEGMEKLSPLTREVVRALGWETIREGDPEVVRGHFLKFFQMARERWFKEEMLPLELRPAPFELPEPPKRSPARGIPPLSEEEAQEKRRRYVEIIGTLLKNLEKGARALEEKEAEAMREDQEECPGEFSANSTLEEYETFSEGA
ncbi:MAG: replicative helicase loader/inhibitor [bacterium]